jgi:hypothetical protein
MSPSIRVDSEVYGFLKERAEPFVDSPNTVLRRLLALDESAADARATPPDGRSRKPRAAKREKMKERRPRSPRSRAKKQASTKAPAGSLLSEEAYVLPLLVALAERGGTAPAGEIIDAVGKQLSSEFKALDRDRLASSGLIRWKNRVQFVRLRLVEQGLLASDSPRGVWSLTDAGRARAGTTARSRATA